MKKVKLKRAASERNFWLKDQDSVRLNELRIRLAKQGVLTNFSEIVCASFLLCEKTAVDALAREIELLRIERKK